MREHMPGQQGWTNRGPRKVRGPAETQAVLDVIRQGREYPRPLSLAESVVAARARAEARARYDAFQQWAKELKEGSP